MAGQIVFNAEQMKVVTAGVRVLPTHWCARSVERRSASISVSQDEMDSQEERSTLQIVWQQMKTNPS